MRLGNTVWWENIKQQQLSYYGDYFMENYYFYKIKQVMQNLKKKQIN